MTQYPATNSDPLADLTKSARNNPYNLGELTSLIQVKGGDGNDTLTGAGGLDTLEGGLGA